LGWTGPLIVSLLFTDFRAASAVLADVFSFSVVASWDVEVGLETSTVIDRLPSRGVNIPTAVPVVAFRCGEAGKINELEFDEIFCPVSDSEPSPVSTTSEIASKLFEPGSFGGSGSGIWSGEDGRTGVDGRILRIGGGEVTRGKGGGDTFLVGENARDDGARGGGLRIRGGGENSRSGPTGEGDVGRDDICSRATQGRTRNSRPSPESRLTHTHTFSATEYPSRVVLFGQIPGLSTSWRLLFG
jgi:hypothetical protein